jgi:hypothetical protein
MTGVPGMPHVTRNPRRTAPEKAEERAATRLMAALGFACWHLSQPRRTMQSAGLPDAFYTHPGKRLAVYYEAKSPVGKQSDAQKAFQQHVTACGHEYVVGPHGAMVAWARGKGLIR